ncbi:ankyrin repeat, SAM and basic leucine zipper domain-containing protein 1-like [Mytilus trossulus]|uniref:ankyrin repeat, SAM and basic leucine zipper domain-containing protein 1-like n=1 Tax=Mytilus trossulus TaxID=6551 RepID=UPI0030065D7B
MSCSQTNGESTLQKPSQHMQANDLKTTLKRSTSDDSYIFETPLLEASYYGDIKVVKELLGRDAVDVNLCDKDKCSPLFWAIHEGHELVVTELLQHSAIVNISNDIGLTPLGMASQQGHVNIVKQLLQRSADVNKCDREGKLPLHFARINGHLEVELLLLGK